MEGGYSEGYVTVCHRAHVKNGVDLGGWCLVIMSPQQLVVSCSQIAPPSAKLRMYGLLPQSSENEARRVGYASSALTGLQASLHRAVS